MISPFILLDLYDILDEIKINEKKNANLHHAGITHERRYLYTNK